MLVQTLNAFASALRVAMKFFKSLEPYFTNYLKFLFYFGEALPLIFRNHHCGVGIIVAECRKITTAAAMETLALRK